MTLVDYEFAKEQNTDVLASLGLQFSNKIIEEIIYIYIVFISQHPNGMRKARLNLHKVGQVETCKPKKQDVKMQCLRSR